MICTIVSVIVIVSSNWLAKINTARTQFIVAIILLIISMLRLWQKVRCIDVFSDVLTINVRVFAVVSWIM